MKSSGVCAALALAVSAGFIRTYTTDSTVWDAAVSAPCRLRLSRLSVLLAAVTASGAAATAAEAAAVRVTC